MTKLEARQLSRKLFPKWTRHMRARWVLARLQTPAPKVQISSQRPYSANDYMFLRVSPK